MPRKTKGPDAENNRTDASMRPRPDAAENPLQPGFVEPPYLLLQ